jgi:3-deoxy-7-phosphoheptulonate synthase
MSERLPTQVAERKKRLEKEKTLSTSESSYLYMDDLRIKSYDPLIPPHCLSSEFPLSDKSKHVIAEAREEIRRIMHLNDDRMIVIVGPCSIHDVGAALDYASLLKKLSDDLKDALLIIMRTYFEKPRTTIGWKGLINDPFLDGSFEINHGLRISRKLLCDITEMGVPVACELLDTISPQFYADLVSWGAIGARTTESQLHRELASGVRYQTLFNKAFPLVLKMEH